MSIAVPPPPKRSSSAIRHTMATVREARQLYGDGDSWRISEIAKRLGVSKSTVRRWVLPGENERAIELQRKARQRRESQPPAIAPEALSTPELNAQMLDLRRRGLPYSAIAVVADVYHGQPLTEHSVRHRMRALGVQPQAGKSERMRRQWAEQKAREAA